MYYHYIKTLEKGDFTLMNNYLQKASMPQVEEELDTYKKVFTVARLLDSDNIEKLRKKLPLTDDDSCGRCFFFDDKNNVCENCVAVEAYNSRSEKIKLEFYGERAYCAIARYIEIDDKPYVLELVKYLEDDFLSNLEGREKLTKKITEYHNKAYTDILTGAYNRRYYEEKVKYSAITCGVAMLDIDDFKLYNDLRGHDLGDEVLRVFVETIRKYLRKTDILVRYGGDEFLLIMPDISEEMFSQILHRIKRKIASAQISESPSVHLSASIGGAMCNGGRISDAVVRADKMMMQAKITKNKVFTESDSKEIDERKEKPLILIADDSEMNREILSSMLGEDFEIIEAVNGIDCIAAIKEYGMKLSVVLLDIIMPEGSGFDVLDYMNQNHLIEDIPVIAISGDDSDETIRHAYEDGVSDYISRPFDIKIVYRRVYNTIKLYAKQRRLAAIITQNSIEKEENDRILLRILSRAVEIRNFGGEFHTADVGRLTGILLGKLTELTDRYDKPDRELISTAATLYDIGKICIDERILNKPGKLTPEEFETIKTHTVAGEKLIDSLSDFGDHPLVVAMREICRWHHERYDGNGYPDKLCGDDIPIAAQIVSIAEAYNALVSDRVYRQAFSHEKAMKMITEGECGAFNPILVECLKQSEDLIRPMNRNK